MVKRWHWLLLGSLVVILLSTGLTLASGLITFQLEVIPGFTISGPEQLVFPPVAPGQISQQELTIRVWSNVRWNLSVRVVGEGVEEGLYGTLEVEGANGEWFEFMGGSRTLHSSKPPTGESGREVNIPFRFRGSYSDVPGNYSLQVEFTVVPSL